MNHKKHDDIGQWVQDLTLACCMVTKTCNPQDKYDVFDHHIHTRQLTFFGGALQSYQIAQMDDLLKQPYKDDNLYT